MATSAKRRRLSPNAYVAVEDDIIRERADPETATPKRLSYLSPTKASLARSNPHLLQDTTQAKLNRETEPNRRQSLRDAVLGNKMLVASEEQRQAFGFGNGSSLPVSTLTIPSIPSDHPEIENHMTSNIENADSPSTPHRQQQHQHSSEQLNPSSTPRRNRPITRFASPSIIPQLVNSPKRIEKSTETFEIELPPTPVQLGKDNVPQRPRGLSSSSPSGSERRRIRVRGGNIYSSPLKPKDLPPLVSQEEEQAEVQAEIASGIIEDSQENLGKAVMEGDGAESHAEEHEAASSELMAEGESFTSNDDSQIEKRKTLEALQVHLSTLREDLIQVQAFSKKLSASRASAAQDLEAGIEVILKDVDIQAPISNLPTDGDALFQKNPLPHLSLFAPRNLSMSYATWEKTHLGCQKFVYETTFAASKPWPKDVFSVTLDTVVEWETSKVEDITLVHHSNLHHGLETWIRTRLQDPVLKYDTSTLATGLDRYFQAVVERARVWKALIEPLVSTIHEDGSQENLIPNGRISSEREALSLVPFVSMVQHTFGPSGSHQKTRRSLGSAKQLMLTYEIDLDWTGRSSIETEILTTGFNAQSVQAAKSLFQDLKEARGIFEAFEEVRNILGLKRDIGSGDRPGNGRLGHRMRVKKGKTRRMTAFE